MASDVNGAHSLQANLPPSGQMAQAPNGLQQMPKVMGIPPNYMGGTLPALQQAHLVGQLIN